MSVVTEKRSFQQEQLQRMKRHFHQDILCAQNVESKLINKLLVYVPCTLLITLAVCLDYLNLTKFIVHLDLSILRILLVIGGHSIHVCSTLQESFHIIKIVYRYVLFKIKIQGLQKNLTKYQTRHFLCYGWYINIDYSRRICRIPSRPWVL